MSKFELSEKLKREAFNLEHKIKISDGKKLTLLLRNYAKIISRAHELENPNILYLNRYDD
ncbi:MAG: hypothetical protein P8Y18_04565 [Candidatus Bathyarchaeota archaeon]